jgi:UDP-2-acetamido-3-amino-2,3-dideoxy-glucuronate N-acetyltransferase
LCCIVDSEEAAREAAQAAYPGVEVFSDVEQVLSNPAVKAVCIASPAVTHARLSLQALEAGKDVFVEKPMCLNRAEGEAMVRLADERERILMVGHLLLYHPAVVRMKEMVEQGDLGKIRYVYSNRLHLGKFRTEENIFWSFAPHDISVINYLVGAQPEWVQAEGRDYLTEAVHDLTVSSLGYPGNVGAHIFVSWMHPYKEQRLVVVGEKHMAVFSDTQEDKLVLYPHTIEWVNEAPVPVKAEARAVDYEEGEPLKRECEHFLDCVDQRKTPLTDGRHGLGVVEILMASDRSLSERGRRINLVDGNPEYNAHESTWIDGGAEIGKGTSIWHHTHVMKDAVIGEDCNIGQNVYIGAGVRIGNRCKIQNNVSVYEGNELEDEVFLGPSCVLTNVTNPRAQIKRHALFEKTLFKRGCTVGANATIVCGITIGRYAFIAAGAVVAKPVPDYAMMVGVPARRKAWVSRHGVPLPEPDEDGVMVCPESGFRYREVEPGVVKCLDLDEEAPLPDAMRVGEKFYDEFKKEEESN